MPSLYAVVDNQNVVVNVVYWDGKTPWEPPVGQVLPIPPNLTVGIGDTFDGVTLTPLYPPPTPDDPQQELLQLQQQQQQKQNEIAQAQAELTAIAAEIAVISTQIGNPIPDNPVEIPTQPGQIDV